MKARQAEEDALVMQDPNLRTEEEEDGEMDDIFTDFMKEQEKEVGCRFRPRSMPSLRQRASAETWALLRKRLAIVIVGQGRTSTPDT